MHIKTKVLSGKKFGKWVVDSFSHTKKGKTGLNYQYWNCICDCGRIKKVEGSSIKKGNSRSCGCMLKYNAPKGENSPMWRGDKAKYHAIHAWLRKNFGKASYCENVNCPKTSSRFEWAKLSDKEYKRIRNNFKQLCHKCHFDMDMNDIWKENAKIGI